MAYISIFSVRVWSFLLVSAAGVGAAHALIYNVDGGAGGLKVGFVGGALFFLGALVQITVDGSLKNSRIRKSYRCNN